MTSPKDVKFDDDIANLEISEVEKNGLQFYRNYYKAFEIHNISEFKSTIDEEPLDLSQLSAIFRLISQEDMRFLPIIVCSFADDVLIRSFKKNLPKEIPGGINSMLSGYGPISDLSKRIKVSYAFDLISKDLLQDFDKLRLARNSIAHSWDLSTIDDFFEIGVGGFQKYINDLLPVGFDLLNVANLKGNRDTAFRVRLIFMNARLFYEGAAYMRAKEARLKPDQALYSKPRPKWLVDIASLALSTAQEIGKNFDSKQMTGRTN